MKKNKMMRVASALLVAVLMTTSVISGTFAKYITQDKASDEARVAKWGVELQVVGNLFGDTYKDVIVLEGATDLTVQSVDKAADIVAPGTKNDEGFTISLKGKPEVDGVITTTITTRNIYLEANTYGVMVPIAENVVTQANFDEFTELYYKDGTTFKPATSWDSTTYYTLEDKCEVDAKYYPVVYDIYNGTSKLSSGLTTADSLNAAVEQLTTGLGLGSGDYTAATSTTVYSGTKPFDSNTDLAATLNCDALKIVWEWDIGSNTDANADTILAMIGNVTNGEVVKLSGSDYIPVVPHTDYCLDTMFDISITVTQVN